MGDTLAIETSKWPRDETGLHQLAFTPAHLTRIFDLKYRKEPELGWGPRTRWRLGYFTPDDFYEAMVDHLMHPGADWIDIGCGRDIFPQNQNLARELAHRCGRLVGVDPDPNVHDNPFVKERHQGLIESFQTSDRFSVITLRMVAEHIEHPHAAVAKLSALSRSGGHVVIFTPSKWAPVSFVARWTPFAFHHPVKKLLWKSEARDTFPVQFKMNTRGRLRELFEGAGFAEVFFSYLPDCRLFAHFRMANTMELALWRISRALRVPYPENCLLGVYRKL
jgi:2-polyprenyl-3-methyl-5-hydroxy-6-metoxy-1,4-benzoquinol methylase